MSPLVIILLVLLILILIGVLYFVLNLNSTFSKLKTDVNDKINTLTSAENVVKNIVKKVAEPVKQQQEVVREIYPNLFTPGNKWDYRSTVRPGYSGVISMRNIDFPYQELTTPYLRVGTVYSSSNTDDTVMTLYRRDIAPERDWYEYKVIDTTNGSNIEMFLNPSITYLRNGEKITIPGYENKGEFTVRLDSQYNYMRLNPYPSNYNFY